MTHPFVQVMTSLYSQMETATATAKAKAQTKPPIRKSLTLTQRKVAQLCRQNTGCHILDSGGSSGRGWQRNQTREFNPKASGCKVEFSIYEWKDRDARLEIDFTVDVWTWLCDKATYDGKMQRAFDRFAKLPENENDHWLGLMEKFPEWYANKQGETAAGIYGDGDPIICYTYNDENCLSQDIQFCYWTTGERGCRDEHLLVQIHNGADARGGLTSPLAMTCNEELSIFEYRRCTLSPDYDELKQKQAERSKQGDLFPESVVDLSNLQIVWDSDNGGYSWSFEGYLPDSMKALVERHFDYPFKSIETRDEWEQGTICVLPDKTALCPITGCTLRGWYM
jgi:hypothetical protein